MRSDNLELAIKLANLPDAVRGYGAVKDRYLTHAEQQAERLLQQWRGSPPLFHDAAGSTQRIPTLQL